MLLQHWAAVRATPQSRREIHAVDVSFCPLVGRDMVALLSQAGCWASPPHNQIGNWQPQELDFSGAKNSGKQGNHKL